jgi:hypothetical protein
MPSVDEFRAELWSQFREADARNLPQIEINSGQLHKKVGGYPGPKARMPSCCQAMYHEQRACDEVICQPPSGKGATLTIRYRLPRSAPTISKDPRPQKPPVNVAPGISAGHQGVSRGHRRLTVAGYDFEFICEIEPQINSDGTVKQFMPQSQYENLANIALNKYGRGPFCKFRISNQNELRGVYIFTVDGKVQYVGECEKFSSRFNMGYGNISPRNCFKGGQETNCRLNNLVYRAATTGEKILLWLFHTADHKEVEAKLRAIQRPAWNRI